FHSSLRRNLRNAHLQIEPRAFQACQTSKPTEPSLKKSSPENHGKEPVCKFFSNPYAKVKQWFPPANPTANPRVSAATFARSGPLHLKLISNLGMSLRKFSFMNFLSANCIVMVVLVRLPNYLACVDGRPSRRL